MSPDTPKPVSDGPIPDELVQLGEDDPADLSFPAVAGFFLRHIRLLTLVPFVFGALGMVLGLLFGRAYTATSQFVPEMSDGGLGRYSSIAASVGFALPGGATGQSPQFYAALLKSPATLRRLALTRFRFDAGGGEIIDSTYLALSGIERPTAHRTMLGVIKLLDSQVKVSADVLTGVVEVQTVAKWVPLAEQMNRRLLDIVAEFNDERRRRIAAAEREFVDGRLAVMRGELEAAEAEMRQFLERNRGYQNSPQLVLEGDRIRRDLAMRQQVVATLAQALESARIEEVRNTPQVTIVTPPEGTADRPRLLRSIFRGAALGGLLALLSAFALERASRDAARRPADYEALRRLKLRDLYDQVVGRRMRAGGGDA